MSLIKLCQVTKIACDILSPIIYSLYGSLNSETSKLKSDNSAFTIADGLVQHLFKDHLFSGSKFLNIVGEEDESKINIVKRPFTVDDLIVPEEFCNAIESTRFSFQEMAKDIDTEAYKSLTIFIDPIDGTREFSTGLGEQCSICIGFADIAGRPAAGVVYRPLTDPKTYAAGAASEGYAEQSLNMQSPANTRGLLTSNGSVSPFLVALMKELNYERVPSGGAGNKMLMLLEGRGSAYIQDRGVSRWDTCGAQAILEANHGCLAKLSPFISHKSVDSYKYLQTSSNLDFESGLAAMTPYNSYDKNAGKDKKAAPVHPQDASAFKPYANLCGLLALNKDGLETQLDSIHQASLRAQAVSSPAFD